ncbi:unnamed protein product [Kuraishia capsulata CBS 1993]|uniref:Metal resistance protein YCF1 n=1 Tax=Kuraishia capsulata CBS 1993 TaxID=1382522 RepID=W6MVH9_9ASCO|nr:uncharacterized protein KUCA_T00005962001 [Kuraishia capsulata CBS 1993]CDK29967.1 unnamed protein product [Kuraishia capsulata CBS 1993]
MSAEFLPGDTALVDLPWKSSWHLTNLLWDMPIASVQAQSTEVYATNHTQKVCFLGCLDGEGFSLNTPFNDLSNCLITGVFLNAASALLLFGGIYQILSYRKLANRTMKVHWSLPLKLVLIALQVSFQIFQAIVISQSSYPDPSLSFTQDIKFWSAVLAVLSLCVGFVLHYVENFKTVIPSGVLLFYWFFSVIFGSLRLSNLWLRSDRSQYMVSSVFLTLNALIVFLLEFSIHPPKSENEDFEKENPYEYSSIFGKITFTWMTPLMSLGHRKFLVQSDLPKLPHYLTAKTVFEGFSTQWEREKNSISGLKKSPSLALALARAYGGQYFIGACFKLIQDSLAYSQPQLLRKLIKFVTAYNEDNTIPLTRGFIYVLAMFASSVVQTACLHQYFQRAFETGMKIKSALISSIYQKSLNMSVEAKQDKATGDIVNLMSVDTQRLQDLSENLQMLWYGPYQITLCLLSLYNLMGSSMWIGVVIMVIMIPVNSFLFKLQKTQQRIQMKNKDERTRITSEILNNIKSLKLYGWEEPYKEKLEYVRNEKELKTLKKIGLLRGFSQFIFNTAPNLVSCSTFLVFILLNKDVPLSTDIVFTALSLFNLLSFPLAVIPMVISNVIESRVAIQRLSDFLTGGEIQDSSVSRLPAAKRIGDVAVKVEGAQLLWSKHPLKVALNDVNYEARKGELNCIVGKVGSGKSSMMQAILGDLHKSKGLISVHGSSAYVAQVPWVMNGTIKENILFGCRFDPVFYDLTVKACALDPDFAILPDGDATLVGEKGISLSGGQKARVSLARAVYARADVYLLDDPLSAVDEHVGKHIIKNVLGPDGLLHSKCKVLATNNLNALTVADHITLMEGGKMAESGSYDDVMAGKLPQLDLLIKTFGRKDNTSRSQNQLNSLAMEATESSSSSGIILDEDVKSKLDSNISRRASLESFEGAVLRKESHQLANQTGFEEKSQQGQVKRDVYWAYAKACRPPLVIAFLLLTITSMSLGVAGNVWLKHWSEVNTEHGENPHAMRYLAIYFGFGIAAACATFSQSIIQWQFCSVAASRFLHSRMIQSVLRAPMSFFETTPIGRILNRFTNDMYKIDETVSMVFSMFFANTAKVTFTILVICYSTWQFLLLILPMAYLYRYYQQYYLRTSRELRRLDSVSRSPVYAHFQETLNGVATIRAYGQLDRFKFLNQHNMDHNIGAYHPAISANRWLAVRLEFLGSLIILSSAGLLMLTLRSGKVSAGIVGLSVSYALQITQSLNWIVRMTVEIETNIVSVERVLEYSELPSEAPEVIDDHRPPAHWPFEGSIKFENYSTRYRPELNLVLKNINLDIKPKEKIGIVGRTGAGKSSLTLALFRMIEAAEGDISVDNIVTESIGLGDLRHKLSIIPQDSQVFEGTLRENLDPTNQHPDEKLWKALELAHLKDHITSMANDANEPDVLKVKLSEGGSNLSVGQKQLICLARALIVESKVLVLDEATAAVDVETDKVLQETIRSEFKDRTILTIAHRLNTIMDSDKVLVLEKGEVAEFDTPANLLKKKDSLFYSLAEQGGLVEDE